MTTLPASIGYGRVKGRFIKAILDTPDDVDELPDAVPFQGSLVFTATPKSYLIFEDEDTVVGPGPFTINLDPDTGEYDKYVVATDDTWNYRVDFNIIDLDIASINIDVPPGSTQDITDWLPIGADPGTGELTMRGPRGYPTFLTEGTLTNSAFGTPLDVTFNSEVFNPTDEEFVQTVDFQIPSGRPAPVCWESSPGVYTARIPGGLPHIFIGSTNPGPAPTGLGLMLDGDGWWDTSDPGTPGVPPSIPIFGNGIPEGAVVAPVGTEYVDLVATRGAKKWYKATGTGNTGWIVTLGDTGWATITPLFSLASGTIQMRRINERVYIRFNTATLAANQTLNTNMYAPPLGYRSSYNVPIEIPRTAGAYQRFYTAGATLAVGSISNPGSANGGTTGWSTADVISGSDSWMTDDAWPAVLAS